MQPTRDNRSVGDLVMDLTQQASTLIRKEVDLAQAEIRSNVSSLGRNIAVIVIGGLVIYTGVIGMLITGIVLLAQVLPWWQATLIGGGTIAILGIIIVLVGRSALKHTSLMPSRTMRSINRTHTDTTKMHGQVPA